jgi:hypothetical protein
VRAQYAVVASALLIVGAIGAGLLAARLVPVRDPAYDATVEQRAGDFGFLPHLGAGLARVIEEERIELEPRLHDPDAGQVAQLRPGQVDPHAAADPAEALHARPLGALGVDPHRVQLADPARREPVPADLLTREARLVDHEHPAPARGKVEGSRGSRRPTPHHDHVEPLGHARLRRL